MITLGYAGLFGLMMAILSIRVPMRRAVTNISWGDGGDENLSTRIRVFGNFTEYVPAILLLCFMIETNGGVGLFLHIALIALIGFRVLHAFILKAGECNTFEKTGRGIAAMGNWLVLVACSVYALWLVSGAGAS